MYKTLVNASQTEDPVLPMLLAGPILRRPEPEKVCIWIATSVPVRVGVKSPAEKNKISIIDEENDKPFAPSPIKYQDWR